MDAEPELVRVGQVIKPHGLRGELVVEPTGDTLASMKPPAQVWIGQRSPNRIESMRAHQGRLLVTVEGCADRDAAERLRGASVRVRPGDLPPLSDSEWYVDDLVGYRLEDAAGRGTGVVAAVVEGGPHDLLEVTWGDRRVLVPMVRDWLVRVEPQARLLVVRLPDGLLDANVAAPRG